MSEVATQASATRAVSKAKPPVSGPGDPRVVETGDKGDRELSPGRPGLAGRSVIGAGSIGSVTVHRPSGSDRPSSEKSAGKNVLGQEAIDQELGSGYGRNWRDPTRRRSSGCWPSGPPSVGSSSIGMKTPMPTASGWTIAQADLQQRKIDKAHARFLSAVRTLAQVRKLALPTLQVNIARNQVNVAETRS